MPKPAAASPLTNSAARNRSLCDTADCRQRNVSEELNCRQLRTGVVENVGQEPRIDRQSEQRTADNRKSSALALARASAPFAFRAQTERLLFAAPRESAQHTASCAQTKSFFVVDLSICVIVVIVICARIVFVIPSAHLSLALQLRHANLQRGPCRALGSVFSDQRVQVETAQLANSASSRSG